MKNMLAYLYWGALFGVWCFAALYVAAMVVAPSAGLQITGMLGFAHGSNITIFYGWLYTAALLFASVAGLLSKYAGIFRGMTILLAGIAVGLTILPVGYSCLFDFQPSFDEHYVGEVLTIAALLLLSIAIVLLPHSLLEQGTESR